MYTSPHIHFHWSKQKKWDQIGGLGFQDFESFNLAMLAKQGWRLLQTPDSLSTWVLKLKYFPKPDFLQAKMDNNSSFVWRSILSSRSLLDEGIIWRIVNEEFVRIWSDRWFPQPSSFKPKSVVKILNAEAKVAELIDANKKSWNLKLVKEVFSDVEAKIICQIPICLSNRLDKIMWRCTKNGFFTVRSAYPLQGEVHGRSQGQTS